MVARRPFLRRSPTLSSTIPGYAGDHKGPPHTTLPPSPLRMLMGFSLGGCVLGAINRARGVGRGQRTEFANSIMRG